MSSNQTILESHLEKVKSIGAAKDKKEVKSLTVTGLPSTAMILSPFDRTCLMLFRQPKAHINRANSGAGQNTQLQTSEL